MNGLLVLGNIRMSHLILLGCICGHPGGSCTFTEAYKRTEMNQQGHVMKSTSRSNKSGKRLTSQSVGLSLGCTEQSPGKLLKIKDTGRYSISRNYELICLSYCLGMSISRRTLG